MTTLVFIVILAFCGWRGYRKGFTSAVTAVISFIIAYPAAIFFTKPVAQLLRVNTGLDGLLVFMIASSGIFLAVGLSVSFAIKSFAQVTAYNISERNSKIGGTVCGALIGCAMGFIAVYMLSLIMPPAAPKLANISEEPAAKKAPTDAEIDAIKRYVIAGDVPASEPLSTVAPETFIDSTAKKLVSTVAATAVGIITADDHSSQLTKTLTQNPQATLTHVRNIANNSSLKTLLSDTEFQAELNHGEIESLVHNKDFQQLLKNPDMKAIIAADDSATDMASQLRNERATAEKMLQAWQKIARLKTDPRVVDIMSDPIFQAQLNSSNKLPLLMNPKLRQLSEILFNDDVASDNHNALQSLPSTRPTTKNSSTVEHYTSADMVSGAATPQTRGTQTDNAGESVSRSVREDKIYRWTDADGKVHYTDQPIKH